MDNKVIEQLNNKIKKLKEQEKELESKLEIFDCMPSSLLISKFDEAENQINNIISRYDKLSRNILSNDEKYGFYSYIINLYKKSRTANNNFYDRNGFDVVDKLDHTIKSMIKSKTISDKVIYLDQFIGFNHEEGDIIPIMTLNNTGFDVENASQKDECAILKWHDIMDERIVRKLDEISERIGEYRKIRDPTTWK